VTYAKNWRTGKVWASDFLKQAEGLSLNDNFDILLEKWLSGVAKQEYDVVWKSRVTYYRRLRFHRLSQFKDVYENL